MKPNMRLHVFKKLFSANKTYLNGVAPFIYLLNTTS